MRDDLARLPIVGRFTVIGALIMGSIGAVTGLAVGIAVHMATAWAALFELGIPAALVGAGIGCLVGLIALPFQRRSRPAKPLARHRT